MNPEKAHSGTFCITSRCAFVFAAARFRAVRSVRFHLFLIAVVPCGHLFSVSGTGAPGEPHRVWNCKRACRKTKPRDFQKRKPREHFFGGATRNRTGESRICSPLPYRLAMAP